MAKQSPTSKALQELREQGYLAEKVEQRLPIPGKYVTRDLFGIIDIVAIKAGEIIRGVQVTTRDHVSHRMTKAHEKGNALTWVQTGASFEIWGYGGKSGKRVVALNCNGQWMEELCGNSSVELGT